MSDYNLSAEYVENIRRQAELVRDSTITMPQGLVLALLDEVAALRANLRGEAESHQAAKARAQRWRDRCDEERRRLAAVKAANDRLAIMSCGCSREIRAALTGTTETSAP